MLMENTDKTVCRELAQLLADHGVRRVFVSPGSRNAPIIVAVARCERLSTTVVTDERSSAFMAMGYASVSGEPVALVCTSGSALLNYAPAIAEAYYRKLPLIVVSADRPMEWIDQDDSQTLKQPGALDNYVKLSCDIPEITTPNLAWYANRKINDAILSAISGRKAPVHINIQLDAPLGLTRSYSAENWRVVDMVTPQETLSPEILDALSRKVCSTPRVMVIAGFNPPDEKLNEALEKIAAYENVAVLTETIANLHSERFISRIDTTLSAMTDEDKHALAPSLVITLGGALVSRFVKEYLRDLPAVEHWHIGKAHTTIDCFRHLSLRVEINPDVFFSQIAAADVPVVNSNYNEKWHAVYRKALKRHDDYQKDIQWSDMKAFATMLPLIPKAYNLQLSNGTPVRYAQLFGDLCINRSDCNRGVSGIDGCTSTALGASMAYPGTTMLISGDTSAQYDVGSLSYVTFTPRFKMVVICNGGGGIFRFISATSSLPEVNDYLALDPNLPLKHLAAGYGMKYFEVHEEESLKSVFNQFIGESSAPAILAIHTPTQESAQILKNYFKYIANP